MRRRDLIKYSTGLIGLAMLPWAHGAVHPAADSDPAPPGGPSSEHPQELRMAVRCPEDFGAVGDGITDDTAAIQSALDHAAATGCAVHGGKGTYKIRSVLIRDGVREVDFSQGLLKSSGTTVGTVRTGGVVNIDGTNFLKGKPVHKLRFKANIDVSAGDTIAVFVDEAYDCVFEGCRIGGFGNHATKNHYALVFAASSSRNLVTNNVMRLFDRPLQRGFGVAFYGGPAAPYGGFFTGKIVSPLAPCRENVISKNVVEGGSYGVSCQYSSFNTVIDNTLRNQNHRSIYFTASEHNEVVRNECLDYKSSAVVLGYGSRNNRVLNNQCVTEQVGGEAAMNLNTGAYDNLISDNSIDTATNYGVYMGGDCSRNIVENNRISNCFECAIVVENDFVHPRPANAFFARTNYGPPPAPYDRWSYVGSFDNQIIGNTFGPGHAGRKIACIAINQLNGVGKTATARTTISKNIVSTGENIAYNLFFYADDPAKNFGNTVSHNRFREDRANGYFDPWGARKLDSKVAVFEAE